MKTTHKLKAIDDFKCTGIDCESNCCKQGWQIKIDPETLNIWKHMDDTPLKSRFLEKINIINIAGTEVPTIAQNNEGICFHLDEDSQCLIHKNLGPEVLPDFCFSYPRLYFSSISKKVDSATMSCPEIARLVVESKDENIYKMGDINNVNLKIMGSEQNALENYLDMWTRLVMREDNSFSIKLYYIGSVVNELNSLSESTGLSEKSVLAICNSYKEKLRDIEQDVTSGNLKSSPVVAGWYWNVINNFSISTFEELSGLYSISNPFDSFRFNKNDLDEKEFEMVYTEISKLFKKTESHFKNYQFSLNNYLKTLFINMGFPWNPIGGNFIASYIKSVFHFSSAYFLLALIADCRGSIQNQDVVRVIYHVERNLFHRSRLADIMKKSPDLFNIDQYIVALLDM